MRPCSRARALNCRKGSVMRTSLDWQKSSFPRINLIVEDGYE
jgi:hypothetical protein